MKIAFLGLGAMGSRMAHRLVAAGFDVVVWNRQQARTALLAQAGAGVAPTPRGAARGADVVIAMVRDDRASASVWLDSDTGALAVMAPGTCAIECSTLTVGWARELAHAATQAGVRFLDAPVAGSRPQAEAGQLIFLVGGPGTAVDACRPVLGAMGSALHHVGENGAGAMVKLMVNALYGAQVAMLAEMLGVAQRAGLDLSRAADAIGETPVCSVSARNALRAMVSGDWKPAFPIDLVAKDFSQVRQTAAAAEASIPVAEAVGKAFADAVADGFGADNATGLVQRYVRLGG